jgi:hypothetical protein
MQVAQPLSTTHSATTLDDGEHQSTLMPSGDGNGNVTPTQVEKSGKIVRQES